ncbi:MAG: long-chain fatty acid--CoA ligase, partial [Halobacteriales archaeon]|nr:long-chain fatty acid--CoA ligase [Halobacteriales archaeon]
MDLTFHEVLDRTAERRPDHPAIIGPDPIQAFTYDEFADRSRRLAASLADRGIAANERVVFQLPNSAEFLVAFMACSRIGAIPVMVLPRHREAEVSHVVDLTDATAIITDANRYDTGFDYIELVDGIRDRYPHLDSCIAVTADDEEAPPGWLEFSALSTAEETVTEGPGVDPAEPGVMLLSGGTTGMPKGIPRTHNDYVFQWKHMARVVGVEEDWIAFPSVPIGHNASLCCVVGAALWRGATVAIEPRLKPDALMALIERFEGSFSLPIPTQIIDILEHPDLDQYDLSSLKVLISGGQKVPPHAVYESVERWDIGFCNIFGMAEG